MHFSVFGLGNSAFPKFNIQRQSLYTMFFSYIIKLCDLCLNEGDYNINEDFRKWISKVKNLIYFFINIDFSFKFY